MNSRQEQTESDTAGVRIAVDVGGTFTDLVVVDADGTVRREKSLSTPPEFEFCVLEVISKVCASQRLDPASVQVVNHGTTVATNALLERRGARTALITTKGFRDVLELRRVRAPQIYDLFFQKPPTIVDRFLCLELNERIAADGSVLSPVLNEDLQKIVKTIQRESVESVAVCLLHSYAHPQHEQQVGQYLRQHLPETPVSLSYEILPERKEYERTATTAVNAYVRPVMRRYLDALHAGLTRQRIDAPLRIMQSAGGLTPAADAAERPIYSLESGPAAGVLAAAWCARHTGQSNIISFDMGGTTAKAAMVENGNVPYSVEHEVGAALSAGNRLTGGGGELIMAPSIDIAEVGAGGGSIAYLDAAHGLRVGPRSAGAVPGPACYQRGGRDPTVTDANVILGYIKPGPLADGDVVVDVERARQVVDKQLAQRLDMSLQATALGVHQIVNAQMLRALREVSTQRGRDPRGFTLIGFGGSGPVHAAGLARELEVRRVMIPPMPGVFSAVGLLASGVEHHAVRSCQITSERLMPSEIREPVENMRYSIESQFRDESTSLDEVRFLVSLELRYHGQTSQLRINLTGANPDQASLDSALENFETEYERLYGYRAERGTKIEVVAIRMIGRTPPVGIDDMCYSGETQTARGSRLANFGPPWGQIDTRITNREALRDGAKGPLLIDEYDSTIVIPPDWYATTDSWGNIVLEMSRDKR